MREVKKYARISRSREKWILNFDHVSAKAVFKIFLHNICNHIAFTVYFKKTNITWLKNSICIF